MDGTIDAGTCRLCSARGGRGSVDGDLLGEVAFDEAMSLDHASSGRIALWRDDDLECGACVTILVDNTRSTTSTRSVNRLPSITCLPIRYCPLCGRDLSHEISSEALVSG